MVIRGLPARPSGSIHGTRGTRRSGLPADLYERCVKELNVGDITQVEANIHAGLKYFRFMIDEYFKDEPMDKLNKGLFTFAAYNAGPGRIGQLRREAENARPQCLVRQRGADRVGAHRPGDGHLREQHLQVLRRYRLLTAERARREAAKLRSSRAASSRSGLIELEIRTRPAIRRPDARQSVETPAGEPGDSPGQRVD
jgi:Transglycosylase SLT domain